LRSLIIGEAGYNVPFPLPSVPDKSPYFDPRRYWRGPVWINMNWFVIVGLQRYGFTEEAQWLRTHTLGLVEKSGFREYYNPMSGEGLGATSFSWTAALTIDLLDRGQALPEDTE
jgi:glycogen debranching enzyme